MTAAVIRSPRLVYKCSIWTTLKFSCCIRLELPSTNICWSGWGVGRVRIVDARASTYSGHWRRNDNDNPIERRNPNFLTISSLRRELSPIRKLKWPRHNRVQITCNTSSAYHVQHVVCQVVRRDSSAIKFDRIQIAFTLALFYWLNH